MSSISQADLGSQRNIYRSAHDSDNPFGQINQCLQRDKTLSNECYRILMYLLSHKDDWNVNIAQLVNYFRGKIGRNKVYEVVNEAIEAGYMKRIVMNNGNLRAFVTYKVAEYPKFKADSRLPAPRNTETSHIKNEYKERKRYVSSSVQNVHKPEPVHKPSPPPEPDPLPDPIPVRSDSIPFSKSLFSIDAGSEEMEDLLEILELEPTYTPIIRPNIMTRWITKFGPKTVLTNLQFLLKIMKIQKEPIRFPERWMEVALKKDYANVENNCRENKKYAYNLQRQKNLTSLKIKERYCVDTEKGKDFYFNRPCDTFKQALAYLLE